MHWISFCREMSCYFFLKCANLDIEGYDYSSHFQNTSYYYTLEENIKGNTNVIILIYKWLGLPVFNC